MRYDLRYTQEIGAVALMQMGYRNYQEIGDLIGLPAEEIAAIDLSSKPNIRAWAVAGLPLGEYADLRRPIRCRGCGAMVNKAPCLLCQFRARQPDY